MAARVELTAAILVGGRARRMGGIDKALLTIDGARIIDRQLAVLRPFVDPIFVVARDIEQAGRFLGLPVVVDRQKGCGPLGGLEAALGAMPGDQLLLLAGDMPYLQPSLIGSLRTTHPEADAVVPRIAGRPEPLCARYHRRILERVGVRLEACQLAMHELLGDLEVAYLEEPVLRGLDPELRSFVNVNSLDATREA